MSEYLVDSSLAAAVDIIPGVKTISKQQNGELKHQQSFLCLIKTTHTQFPVLSQTLKEVTQATPKIVAQEMKFGTQEYFDYIE